MSISIDPGGRRASVSVEVCGSQQEVWDAIATGPGLSSWFLPSELELGFDGEPVRLTVHLGPHTSRAADIKEWEEYHRFRTVSEDQPGAGPPLWTEWSLEPLGLGCRVKVEHWLESDAPEGEQQLRAAAQSWPGFLRVLSLYLEHFAGKRGQGCTLLISTTEPPQKAWETLAEPLGLSRASAGDRVRSEADGPILAGVLEALGDQQDPLYQALLRLDDPAPGIAHLQISQLHGCHVVTVRLYFYGEQCVSTVTREEPRWQAWLSELFTPA
jgi:hypothetical protein